jgi:hypothetical protein
MVMVRAPEAVHHHNDSRDVRINAATDRNPETFGLRITSLN